MRFHKYSGNKENSMHNSSLDKWFDNQVMRASLPTERKWHKVWDFFPLFPLLPVVLKDTLDNLWFLLVLDPHYTSLACVMGMSGFLHPRNLNNNKKCEVIWSTFTSGLWLHWEQIFFTIDFFFKFQIFQSFCRISIQLSDPLACINSLLSQIIIIF